MRKGRFSEEQIVGILRETDKDPVAQVAKRHGFNEQTIYGWRQCFSGMNADDVKCLRQLEQENTRLKRLLAERDLEIEVMKEVTAKNGRVIEILSRLVSERGAPHPCVRTTVRSLSPRRSCAGWRTKGSKSP